MEAAPEPEHIAPLPLAPLQGPPQPPPRQTSRLHLALTITLAAVCLVLAILLTVRARQPKAPSPSRQETAALPANLDWFWHPFLPPADPPLIVIPNHPLLRAAHDGDSPQTIAGGHEIPKSSLPEFRDTIHFRELKRFVFVPSLTDFTAVGETLGVVRLCEMFFRAGEPCKVQPSRLVNFEEIKNGNAILLGGSQNWSGRVFLDVEGFPYAERRDPESSAAAGRKADLPARIRPGHQSAHS